MEMEMEYPPRGWKFHPTDIDILHFLHDHVRGVKLPTNVISELELYKVNLREVFDGLIGDPSEPNTKYVIVEEKKKHLSPKIDRNIGDFYWKDLGKSSIIQGGEVPGSRRLFSLIRKKGNPEAVEEVVKYQMMVYDGVPRPVKFKNTVLCKLMKIQKD